MNIVEEEVLSFQLNRNFAVLSRNLLVSLENLRSIHEINFTKLYQNLPPEYEFVIKMADYFDENNYARTRKIFLDNINNCRRDLEFVIKELNPVNNNK